MSARDICLGLGVVALLWYAGYHQRRRSRLPLPPGPPKLPLIGHLLELPGPGAPLWETWAEWSEKYRSDVIHVEIPLTGTSLVIINSLKICKELFEKRSSLYSSRPRFVMAGELVGWDWQFLIQPYNQKWKDQRKMFTQYFHPSKTSNFHPVLLQQAHSLLHKSLDAPEDISHHITHVVSAMAIQLAYGIEVLPHDDPHVQRAERALDGYARAATPGAFLVDVLPFLKHMPSFMPGTGFQKQAAIWPQKEIEEGIAKPSFTAYFLENSDGSKFSAQHVEYVKERAFLLAAAHTTSSLILTFTLAMVLFPEVQRKIQEELDRVVGQGRLPDFEHLDSLPYLVATIKRRYDGIQRRRLVTVPHSLTEDDEYNGWRIPKGSMVFGNAWAILHSEEHFKEPMLDPTVLNPFDVAFGFGRRQCPGINIGFAMTFICTASLLSTFNITKSVDKNGNVIDVPGKFEHIIVLQPSPFKCTLVPRNKDLTRLINNLS
ncbi:cytochrome P450 [Amanita rubescens]|nr:cytochrome P450 [Amanita rubescens]